MTKRLKAPSLASEAEFRALVDEIAALQAIAAEAIAKRELIVQRIQQRYAIRLQPIEDAIDAKLALVEKYAEEHRAELLPKDRKSAETTLATFGWRTGNRTVSALGKKWTLSAIITALKVFGLSRYIRTTPELAKELLLAECTDDKTVTVTVGGDPVAGFVKKQVALADVGLKITQKETFYIEPKAENAETLKPAEAVAK